MEQAHAFLQQTFTPFPALGYVEGNRAERLTNSAQPSPTSSFADVQEGEMPRYEIEVVEQQRFSFRVDPAYVDAYR